MRNEEKPKATKVLRYLFNISLRVVMNFKSSDQERIYLIKGRSKDTYNLDVTIVCNRI